MYKAGVSPKPIEAYEHRRVRAGVEFTAVVERGQRVSAHHPRINDITRFHPHRPTNLHLIPPPTMLSTPRSRGPSSKQPALSGSASFEPSSTIFSDAFDSDHPVLHPGRVVDLSSHRAQTIVPSRIPRGSFSPSTSCILLHPRLLVALIHHSHPLPSFDFRPLLLQRYALSFTAPPAIASSNVPFVASLTIDTPALSPPASPLPHVVAIPVIPRHASISTALDCLSSLRTSYPVLTLLCPCRHRSLPRVHLLSTRTSPFRIHASVPRARSVPFPASSHLNHAALPSHLATSLPPAPLHHPSASVSPRPRPRPRPHPRPLTVLTRPFHSLSPSLPPSLPPLPSPPSVHPYAVSAICAHLGPCPRLCPPSPSPSSSHPAVHPVPFRRIGVQLSAPPASPPSTQPCAFPATAAPLPILFRPSAPPSPLVPVRASYPHRSLPY
ncbi:hypothetical protein DFH09DRAFT_1319775 [Mycena vulgaris]|nr:hypothetical protein DFH09DRAFT_1319775 [Mycena vulgaris]